MNVPVVTTPRLRIRCAICGGPAQRVTTWRDEGHQSWRIVVDCHGDRDSMTLSDYDIARLGKEGVDQIQYGEGVAFSTPRLGTA